MFNIFNKKAIDYEKEINSIFDKLEIYSESEKKELRKKTLFDITKLNIEIKTNKKPFFYNAQINKYGYILILSYKRRKYVLEFIGVGLGILYFEWIGKNTNQKIKIKKETKDNSIIYKQIFKFKTFKELNIFCICNGIKIKKH